MSNNFSIENNESRWSNYSSYAYDYSYTHYIINLIIVNATFAVAGTLVNVWFLTALLLSPEIRSRLRNKIMCSMLVVNLTESGIFCPFNAIRWAADLLGAYHLFVCYQTVHNNIYHIQDFVGNWYIVILLCVYVSQVMNLEPKVTPIWKNILIVVILITPCVFASLFVPLTMKSFYAIYSDHHCFSSTLTALQVYKSLDTIVPLTLASLLLLVTAVLKYRRYPYGRFSDTFHAQLIDDRSQVDAVYPFLALLLTAVASDFCAMVTLMNLQLIYRLDDRSIDSLFIATYILSFLRLIFLPVMLLLFPDIRERIKTWRPCRRSAPPADVVVTFEKNTS